MSGPELQPDLCVIGAGSGGLSVAAGAVQMGASVVLVERDKMGGDCLNYGCVPSKSLIEAAGAVRRGRDAAGFGVRWSGPEIDGSSVYGHVRAVIAAIAPQDSEARFAGLGVTVLKGEGRFVSERAIAVGEIRVRPRRFVIATGSHPALPPIAGLAAVPVLTNETIFERDRLPDHLLVIGGGPIGIELAQAHRRLGSRVTLIEAASLLGSDDPELVACVRRCLAAEGIDIKEGALITGIEPSGAGILVRLAAGDWAAGSHLLVATGRRPSVDGLDLERAGIAHDLRGIQVDARLRTSNRRAFAIGDVAGGGVAGGRQFTHLAGYQAGIVLRNALFRLPARVDYRALPRVTYSDPELAQVGLTEDEAHAAGIACSVLRAPFAENDRAQTQRLTDGLVKAVVTKRGRILGCGIVGPHAGDLIQPWVLAMQARLKIGSLATMIAPYPTLGEASKRAAGSFYTERLFSERTKRFVRLLAKLG